VEKESTMMMMFQKWCTLMIYIEQHRHTLFPRRNGVWTDEDFQTVNRLASAYSSIEKGRSSHEPHHPDMYRVCWPVWVPIPSLRNCDYDIVITLFSNVINESQMW
jgi:hypothetical protein